MYFNFAGRDFYNALADRDIDELKITLFRFFIGTAAGTPIFVFSRYGKVAVTRFADFDSVELMMRRVCAECLVDGLEELDVRKVPFGLFGEQNILQSSILCRL